MKGEPIRILLVEDNDDHAELVARNLSDHQVANKVWRVSDGREALDYLLRRGAYANPDASPTPHLILLDLRLPKVDGLEVLKELKAIEALHRIPVVILTTSDAEADVAKAQDLHANAYVVKPVDFTKFAKLMQDLGFFWLAWNTPPGI